MTPDPDTTAVWNRIAGWWAEQIGEGNEFQLQLIMPATDRLLDARPGQQILDVACGNGNYARRLSRAGAIVTAFDGATNFIADARKRTTAADGSVEYHVIDATDLPSMLALGAGRFDSAVCSMALMDLPTIDPLLAALHDLLKPGGRFVFSVSHPCFNSAALRLTAEMVEENGKLRQIFGTHVTRYLTPTAEPSVGIINQPEPHTLYHRPLSMLLACCFKAGFVLDGMEEPSFPAGTKAKNAFSWAKRTDIPPAIVLRELDATVDSRSSTPLAASRINAIGGSPPPHRRPTRTR